MANAPSSLRILLSDSATPALRRAAEVLAEALRCETLRPCRLLNADTLVAEDRRFDGLTLLTDPAQRDLIAVEPGGDLSAAETGSDGDRIVIRHLRVPAGLCVLAWGSSPAASQRALAIIGEYLGLRVFPWGRVVVPSHDEQDLVSADVVLQARFAVRGLAPVRMTDRQTWNAGDIAAYADFAAWNGYNLAAWPTRIGTPAVPVRAGLVRFEGPVAPEDNAGAETEAPAEDNTAAAFAAFRARGLQVAAAFDPLRLPPEILDACPAADLHPGGLAIQPFSETGQTLYRHLIAALHAAHRPDALVLAMSELPWRPAGRTEPGQTPDALAFRAQLLGVYGPEALEPETELYLQAAAAVAQAARFLELDLPVILMGRHLAHLTAQQHQVLPEDCSLCPTPAGDLVSLADQVTRDAARGAPGFFDHLHSSHRPVWGALAVDETFLGDSPRVRSLDTILAAWLKAPMEGMLLRHSRLHGCDENLLYTAQAVWGEIPSARLFYTELSTALYGAGAETMARARQGQEEIEAVSSVHDLNLAAQTSAAINTADDTDTGLDDDTLPASAQLNQLHPHEPLATRSLRRIIADLLDRMPLAVEALPDETYLLSFLRDLSSRNVRLAGILQAVEGSLARRDLLSAEQVARIERAAGRLTAKLEMGRFARSVMSAALLCRQAADPDMGGTAFGIAPQIGGLTALHQALATLRKSPPGRINEVLRHEHSCDRQATETVVEQTLIEPWRQLVARLERLLGAPVARRQALGQPQEMLDPRASRRE